MEAIVVAVGFSAHAFVGGAKLQVVAEVGAGAIGGCDR